MLVAELEYLSKWANEIYHSVLHYFFFFLNVGGQFFFKKLLKKELQTKQGTQAAQ